MAQKLTWVRIVQACLSVTASGDGRASGDQSPVAGDRDAQSAARSAS